MKLLRKSLKNPRRKKKQRKEQPRKNKRNLKMTSESKSRMK